MSVVIRSDPSEDRDTMAARLQAHFPSLCKNITAFGLEVGDYFDDYDQQLQGRVFLRAVLLQIAQINAIRARDVQDLAGRWLAMNSEAFRMLDDSHGVDQVFTEDDIDQHDMQLLEDALGLIQSAARNQYTAASQEEQGLQEQHQATIHEERELIHSRTTDFTIFAPQQPVLPGIRVISDPERSQIRPQSQLFQRQGPVRQIPPTANSFLSQQARYPQQRLTPSTELLEHIHRGATNRGDFHSDPTASYIDPPTMDSITAIHSRGLPGPFSYGSLPHVPLADRLRSFNHSILPRGKKNPAKKSSDDARKASFGGSYHRHSSNHGTSTNFSVPISIGSPRNSASPYERRPPTMQSGPNLPSAVQMIHPGHHATTSIVGRSAGVIAQAELPPADNRTQMRYTGRRPPMSTYSQIAQWTGMGDHLQSRQPNIDFRQPPTSVVSRTPKGTEGEQPRWPRVWIGNIPADFGKAVIFEMLSPCRGLRYINEPKATEFDRKTYLWVFARYVFSVKSHHSCHTYPLLSFNTEEEAEEALDRLPQTKFKCLSEGHFLKTGWPRAPGSAQRKTPKAHNLTVDPITPCPSPPGKSEKGGQKHKSPGPMAPERAKATATTVQKPVIIGSDKRQRGPMVDVPVEKLAIAHSDKQQRTHIVGSAVEKVTVNESDEQQQAPIVGAMAANVEDGADHFSTAPTSYLQTQRSNSLVEDGKLTIPSEPSPSTWTDGAGVDPEQLRMRLQADIKATHTARHETKPSEDLDPGFSKGSAPHPADSSQQPSFASHPTHQQESTESEAHEEGEMLVVAPSGNQQLQDLVEDELPSTSSPVVKSAPAQLLGRKQKSNVPARSTSPPPPSALPQVPSPIQTRIKKKAKPKKAKGSSLLPNAKELGQATDLPSPAVESGLPALIPTKPSNLPKPETPFELDIGEHPARPQTNVHQTEDRPAKIRANSTCTSSQDLKEAMVEAGYCTAQPPSSATHFPVTDPTLARLVGMFEQEAQDEYAATQDDRIQFSEKGKTFVMNKAGMTEATEEKALLERAAAAKRLEEGSAPRTPTKNVNVKGNAVGEGSPVAALCARIEMIGLQNIAAKARRGERKLGDSLEDRRAKEARDLVDKSPKHDSSDQNSKKWVKQAEQYIESNTTPDIPLPLTPTRSAKAEVGQAETPLVVSRPGSRTAIIRLKPGEDANEIAAGHLANPATLFGTDRDELASLEDFKIAFDKPGGAMTPVPSQSKSQIISSEWSQNVVGSWNQNSGFKQSDVQEDVEEDNGGEGSSVSRGGYAEAVRKSLDERRDGEEKVEKKEAGKPMVDKSSKEDPWASDDVWGPSKSQSRKKM